MKNQLTWGKWGAANQHKEQAERDNKILELEAKYLRLAERAAALAEQAQILAVEMGTHLVGSASNKLLAKKYSRAACQMTGRTIEVQIRKPGTKGCIGTFSRSRNQGHIQLHPKLGSRSIVNTYLHEIAHVLCHWNSIKPSRAHLTAPQTKSLTIKNPARYERHEDEANALGDELVAALEFDVDPIQPDYENRALDYMIKHSSRF